MGEARSAGVLAMLVLLSTAAHAGIVRHDFSGTLNDVRLDTGSTLVGDVYVGATFTGYYEFDSDVVPVTGTACQTDLSQCYREFSIPPYTFHVQIGGIEIVGLNELEIVVTDDQSGGSVDFYSVYGNTNVDAIASVMTLALHDGTRTAIDDPTQLFLDPPT